MGTDDFKIMKYNLSDALRIGSIAAPADSISEVRISKTGGNVTYSISQTKSDRFLFWDVSTPQNVTIDATTGNVISIVKKTATDVVIDKILKAIFFWTS